MCGTKLEFEAEWADLEDFSEFVVSNARASVCPRVPGTTLALTKKRARARARARARLSEVPPCLLLANAPGPCVLAVRAVRRPGRSTVLEDHMPTTSYDRLGMIVRQLQAQSQAATQRSTALP